MTSIRRAATGKQGTPSALAFYLPQFHPIPENDEWWGKGFTEWTNVTRAQPRFPGHYQPHVPGELGYYDLRVPEIREAQATLAAEHGISGFVYYHYWFHGKRLLERPFQEVLDSGSPDFPFALCWANEEWTRNWDARTGSVLIPQHYSYEDDLEHIRWLAAAFADDRYIKIDGRPLMLIYRAAQLPDSKRTAEIWRTEAQKLGFPDLYLCWVESHGPPPGGPEAFGLDATVAFMPQRGERLFAPLEGTRGHRILDYSSAYRTELNQAPVPWKRFPSVMVEWDNTARRQRAATIFTGATPEAYERWLRATVDSVAQVRDEENYLFILAWNEWAEGNHLEPDRRYGRAFLEATRSVMLGDTEDTSARRGELPIATDGADGNSSREPSYEYAPPSQHDGTVANAAELVRDLNLDRGSTVADLGAGTAMVSHALRETGLAYHGLAIDPMAMDLMHQAGIDATGCDLDNFEEVQSVLDQLEHVGALVILDVIDSLAQPHQLLSGLSAWSLKHGEPALVVSVPNVAHFDLGLRLLCGAWTPTENGLLDSTHLRFFTETTLQRMFERCGWEVLARNNFSTTRTDQYDPDLNDELPAEMIGALRVLSEAYNPHAAVQQFVWALKPVPVNALPSTFLEAVGEADDQPAPDVHSNGERIVGAYLESVGLVASETNRRAAKQLRSPDPRLIQRGKWVFVKTVNRSPRTAAALKRARSAASGRK